MNKRVFLFLTFTLICMTTYYVMAYTPIDLPAPTFNADASSINGLTGKYKGIINQIINISFVIAGVPVVWQIASGSQKAKRTTITYFVAMGIYYGVIKDLI